MQVSPIQRKQTQVLLSERLALLMKGYEATRRNMALMYMRSERSELNLRMTQVRMSWALFSVLRRNLGTTLSIPLQSLSWYLSKNFYMCDFWNIDMFSKDCKDVAKRRFYMFWRRFLSGCGFQWYYLIIVWGAETRYDMFRKWFVFSFSFFFWFSENWHSLWS